MQIQVVKADITTMDVDAVVNAANSSLLGGGGVDGAIHRKGGPDILAACRAIRDREGGCAAGDAVITTSGNLPAQFVIHTVGPVWNGGTHGEHGVLTRCYRSSLSLAVAHGVRSIAFPNISTGIYGFPKTKAAPVAIGAVRDFAMTDKIDQVWFVCFDEENHELYTQLV